jgi:hypothetical protein
MAKPEWWAGTVKAAPRARNYMARAFEAHTHAITALAPRPLIENRNRNRTERVNFRDDGGETVEWIPECRL